MQPDYNVQKIGGSELPETTPQALELADLINAPALQKLMEDFYAVAHIPMSILDLKGRVLVGVGWQQICIRFHRVNPETAKHCLESDTELTADIAAGSYRLYKCKNYLWDIATPIFVGEKHVGNIFSGQFFFDDETIDREQFRAQARRYHFDEEEYLAELENVPRLSRETVTRGMAFLLKLADMLSKQGYNNVRLARLSEERGRINELLERAQQIAHLGSWELDVRTNTLTWSDEVYRIFGLQPQQFGATYGTFLEHVHPDDRAQVDQAYSGSLKENRDTYEIDHRVIRKSSGEIRFVHERCEHIRDSVGNIIRSVGMVHDITERKQLELELRALNEALEARVKQRTVELQLANKEMESFSYTVSHDLKAPLRVIGGFADLLARGNRGELNEKQQEALSIITQEIRQAQRLIDGLLELARVSHKELQFTTVDTRKLVDEVVAQQRLAWAEEGRKPTTVELGELPPLQADPVLLRQVIANLLSNAFKFTRPIPEPVVKVNARREEGQVVFCVSDNGVGFPVEHQEKLFSIFQRLHSQKAFEGTGVGLANVRKIVERHGGKVWATSEQGEGAAFCFSLPDVDPR